MATAKQIERRARVEAAAYELLVEQGYKATSLLAVAQRAGVSNETLYRWYGSKQGLIETLVAQNAREARELVEASLGCATDPDAALISIGCAILRVVTGERAVALNRAAAADAADTGRLGAALAAHGRGAIAPLLASFFGRLGAPDAASELFIRLLVVDLQIRRATGALAPLGEAEIEARAREACALIRQLHPL